jgi:hypothetical protein
VRLVVTGCEGNDITQAPALIPAGSAEVICERGDDADWWRKRLVAADHRPAISGRGNRLVRPVYNQQFYRPSHLVENAFARLKSAAISPIATIKPSPDSRLSSTSPASSSGSCDLKDVPDAK